jgi:hypothetical protein
LAGNAADSNPGSRRASRPDTFADSGKPGLAESEAPAATAALLVQKANFEEDEKRVSQIVNDHRGKETSSASWQKNFRMALPAAEYSMTQKNRLCSRPEHARMPSFQKNFRQGLQRTQSQSDSCSVC